MPCLEMIALEGFDFRLCVRMQTGSEVKRSENGNAYIVHDRF